MQVINPTGAYTNLTKTWGAKLVLPTGEYTTMAFMRDFGKPWQMIGWIKAEIEAPLFWVLVADNLPMVFTFIMTFFCTLLEHY